VEYAEKKLAAGHDSCRGPILEGSCLQLPGRCKQRPSRGSRDVAIRCGEVFQAYPETARPLVAYHEALLRGPSQFSAGERE
jgi:hypothetical protein